MGAYHYIFLAGPKINPWGAYTTFLHELGHIFGLYHLYNYQHYQSECVVVGQSSNDWLTDIFPSNLCVINNPWACDPTLDNSPLNDSSCTGNIMGQGTRYFSPMQLGRMHRMAYLGSSSRYVYPIEAPHITPWTITTSQDWDFGIRMYQDIIVQAGNTLTIKCEVQMPPESRIIVEKGAKLILDGGQITSYHPKATWKGIELYGDINAEPYPSNQGSFEMKNQAIIEHAIIGVQDYQNNIWNGGGIINVSNSTFKDCWRAVGLNHYPNYSRGTSCSFNNVDFITENPNAAANATIQKVAQFAAYNEKGILINNCRFTNKITLNNQDMPNSTYAVYGVNAGFRVQNSTFKGYFAGVTTTTVDNSPARSVKVMNNTFDSLATGIMFSSNFGFAQDNNFDHPLGYVYNSGTMSYYKEGEAVYLDNASGITITRNILNNSSAGSMRGITSNDTRLFGSRIIDNQFNNTRLGVITQRRNPTLDILCNQFTQGQSNIVVNPQSNHAFFTLKDQGNGCDANFEYRAGNTFSGASTANIANYLTNPWKYYYKYTVLGTNPAVSTTTFNPSNPCTDEENNSQCNLPSNVESWMERGLDDAFMSWPSYETSTQLSSLGLQELNQIVFTLNERNSTDSLISFLEAVNTNESKKMLLSLMLETENYGRFDDLLHEIDFATTEEHTSFNTYYNLLKSLKEEGRQLWNLELTEKLILDNIAADSFEHAAFAKAWKEFAFQEHWHHYQEQGFVALPSSHQLQLINPAAVSKLHDAVPNPASNTTNIMVELQEGDSYNATLYLRNMLGQTMQHFKLNTGKNQVQVDVSKLPPGLYTYSLQTNGKIMATKRLSVSK